MKSLSTVGGLMHRGSHRGPLWLCTLSWEERESGAGEGQAF